MIHISIPTTQTLVETDGSRTYDVGCLFSLEISYQLLVLWNNFTEHLNSFLTLEFLLLLTLCGFFSISYFVNCQCSSYYYWV